METKQFKTTYSDAETVIHNGCMQFRELKNGEIETSMFFTLNIHPENIKDFKMDFIARLTDTWAFEINQFTDVYVTEDRTILSIMAVCHIDAWERLGMFLAIEDLMRKYQIIIKEDIQC